MSIVQTDRLSKVYGEFTALDACTLSVEKGEVFGLLGPNGAGKTTLLRTLLGYLAPSSGSASVNGFDVGTQSIKVRSQVSYLPGDARLPRQMRGLGVLKFFADLHPQGDISRATQLAELFELDLRRRVGLMSTGMRQKVALCVVLSVRAPIVVLDEPTANLDPTIRRRVLDEILATRRDGRTVIFSSHVLSEIEEVCDRVVFLRHGKLVLEQSMADLKNRYRITLRLSKGEFSIPESLSESVRCISHEDNQVLLETNGELTELFDWLATLRPADARVEPAGITPLYEQVHGLSGSPAAERPSEESESASREIEQGATS